MQDVPLGKSKARHECQMFFLERATRCCADALEGLANIEYESEVLSFPRRTMHMPEIVFKVT
jgi:hypothetical protein